MGFGEQKACQFFNVMDPDKIGTVKIKNSTFYITGPADPWDPSVLAIVGGQASPGFGLGVLVTSPHAENHPKADFQTCPGRQGRDLLEHWTPPC